MRRIILRLMNTPLLLFIVLIAIGLQTALFSSGIIHPLQPDIMLFAIIWCALRRHFAEGGIMTLIMSNITEIHSGSPQGVIPLTSMLIYLLVRWLSRFIVLQNTIHYTILTISCLVLAKLTRSAILLLLGASHPSLTTFLTSLMLSALVEATLSLWIYRWLEVFDWVTFKNQRAEHEDIYLAAELGGDLSFGRGDQQQAQDWNRDL